MKLIALFVALVLIVGTATAEEEAKSECIPTGEDCEAIRRTHPTFKSGVYMIRVPGRSVPVPVYCDMDTACGGWTVFQRRKDGSESFTRKWADYANGFGDLNGEFWLGNDLLSALTSARPYRLRVDLEDWAGKRSYAEYNFFKVAGRDAKYQLTFRDGSYFGNAGDGMTGDGDATKTHNGMKFSTIDQDNDNYDGRSCAADWKGGFWYNKCSASNPNGEYNNTKFSAGINWNKKYDYSYKFFEMKIRGLDL